MLCKNKLLKHIVYHERTIIMKRLLASLIAIALSFTMAVAVVEQSTVYAVENEATPAVSGLQAMRDSLTLTWSDEADRQYGFLLY